MSGWLPHHDAIICLAGWAWEEAYGDTRGAANDWRAGKESDSKNLDRNLQVARQLVHHAEPVIKACAATLMWGLNKRGKVSERKLQKILACIGPHALKYKPMFS